MTFREIQFGTADYLQTLELREAVLRAPLGLRLTPEELARDPLSIHLACFSKDTPIAILLLDPVNDRTLKMRQVAVHPDVQGGGIGSQLIAFAESYSREQGIATLIAHARQTAVPFYRKLGYTVDDEVFTEVTLPHQVVTKVI